MKEFSACAFCGHQTATIDEDGKVVYYCHADDNQIVKQTPLPVGTICLRRVERIKDRGSRTIPLVFR